MRTVLETVFMLFVFFLLQDILLKRYRISRIALRYNVKEFFQTGKTRVFPSGMCKGHDTLESFLWKIAFESRFRKKISCVS